MLDTNAQGKSFTPYTYEIDRSKIKELCLAIGDNNPLFFDKEFAIKQGYKDTPTPLTMPTLISFWGYPEIWNRMIEIGIDVKRLLHAKEDYEYITPVYPGDILTGTTVVESLRSSSAMDMVTFKTTFTRNNENVIIAKMTIVVMKGVERP